jgi:glutamyl-tRNA reductase
MVFVTCGFNYKTAPLVLREKLAISAADLNPTLLKLKQLPEIQEVILLSTCNRTEFYCETTSPQTLLTTLCQWLSDERRCPLNQLLPYAYTYATQDALCHLLQVASGLDSMVIGEAQILGQLKQAYSAACQAATVHSTLHQVFQYVLGETKKIRTHSGINNHPVSIASIASQLIYKIHPHGQALSILLIGSGDTAKLIAKYLSQQPNTQLTIASRTFQNATQLASLYQAHSIAITDIDTYLPQMQVIISATTCPMPFIHYDLMSSALKKRKPEPLLLLDLAMPRNIEPKVATLPNVLLYNLDDLHQMMEQSMTQRHQAAAVAKAMINHSLDKFQENTHLHRAHLLINQHRMHIKHLAKSELKRAQKKLLQGQNEQAVLSELSHRIVNKCLHTTTTGLRKAAKDNRCDLIDFAGYFYNLEL